MKNECNIVSDLLPNYIDNLLSTETKKFVEEHINSCDECQSKLKTMESCLKDNEKKLKEEDEIEYDYLKKYRKKMTIWKLIASIFIIIIILFFILLIIKAFKINQIIDVSYDKYKYIEDLQNFNIIVTQHIIEKENDANSKESFNTTKYYFKDGKYKEERKVEGVNQKIHNGNISIYGEINSNKQIEVNEDAKSITYITANYNIVSKKYFSSILTTTLRFNANINNVIAKLVINGCFNIRSDRFNGKDCLVLRKGKGNNYSEIWIDKESKLLFREVLDYENQYMETTYTFYTNNVTEEDVNLPSLEGYIIQEKQEEFTKEEIEMLEKINGGR